MAFLSRGRALSDQRIRDALRRRVARTCGPPATTLVVQEFGLFHGESRVDLAVIGHSLHGYEIKSDRDSLRRFPQQAHTYNLVLDRVTIVTGWRHAAALMRQAPRWWGILLAEQGPRGGVRFGPLRTPGRNPQPDARAVVRLLWREEVLVLLDRLDAGRGVRSRRRAELYDRLAEIVGDYRELSALVRGQLRRRVGWRLAGR